METEWRNVPGYEGLYEVSAQGSVRSLNWRNTGKTRELFLKRHRDGYRQVELFKDGNKKMIPVHRLVALAFVPGYKPGLTVNHIDEDKGNNRASNLEWCTLEENIQYSAYRNKGRPEKKVDVYQIDASGKIVARWPSFVAIRKALGYNDWSIRCCCNGTRKSAYGFQWQFAM